MQSSGVEWIDESGSVEDVDGFGRTFQPASIGEFEQTLLRRQHASSRFASTLSTPESRRLLSDYRSAVSGRRRTGLAAAASQDGVGSTLQLLESAKRMLDCRVGSVDLEGALSLCTELIDRRGAGL